MNRTDFLNFDSLGPTCRATEPLEFRQAEDGDYIYRGYASVTEREYDVYGGTFPGWVETIARGAFKRTLGQKPNVMFRIDHAGMELASTTAGDLKLSEDDVGLLTEARLDSGVSTVSDLYRLNKRGNMREMSFAFRVKEDKWLNRDGEEVDQSVGTHRRILAVNLHDGDVSAVSVGANVYASGGFREELVLAELRDGRLPNDDALKEFALRLANEGIEERMVAPGDAMMEHIETIEVAIANLRALANAKNQAPAMTSEELLLQNSADEPDQLIAAYLALHEHMRDPAA